MLIDQAFLETEPVESDMVLEHIGTAVPVRVNFAINNMERVARELRAALQRHQKEVRLVRQEAHTLYEMSSKARSRRCCSRANWHCKFRISRLKPKGRCAVSTNSPRKCASSSKVPSENPAIRSALIPKCNILRTGSPPAKNLP